VDAGGVVLDPDGIELSTAFNAFPSVARGVSNWLVVWRCMGSLISSPYWLPKICARRVADDGSLFGSEIVLVEHAPALQSQIPHVAPAVAFDGTTFLVVWEMMGQLYGRRVGQLGELVGGTFVLATGNPMWPSMSYDGTNFLVAWDAGTGDRNIYGARVNSSGVVLDPGGFVISAGDGDQVAPSISRDGTNFFVAWKDSRNANRAADIFGARVNSAGETLDPEGVLVSAETGAQAQPVVSFDGTNHLVVWQSAGHTVGARVRLDGTVFDSNAATLMAAPGRPFVTHDGTNWLVVTGNRDILMRHVDPAGVSLGSSDTPITTSFNTQR
jgi:hypothetical protein